MAGVRGPTRLADRLDAFDEALALADGRVDADVLAAAREARGRVDERLGHGDDLVVAAFAGGTGTGKSSLFNAVAGEVIAETGVRRPTTDEPQALVAGELDDAGSLLDWLGVRRRHVTDPDGLPAGIVLVDLPDHDSLVRGHHEVSARFAERVDLLVWVVDPLKYARRDLHHEVLRGLAEHAAVVVVVMNHADALSEEDRSVCVADLRRLLDAEGLGGARVLVTSARTGEGVERLRDLLVDEARQRRAVAERVAADVRTAARRLRDAAVGDGAPDPTSVDGAPLVEALVGSGGVEGRAEAAAAAHRAEALRRTRPWLTLVLHALSQLVTRAAGGARSLVERPAGGRAARPEGAAPSAVHRALLDLVEGVAGGLPAAARQRLRGAALPDADALGRAVGEAVDAEPLHPDPRRWWRSARVLLGLAEAAVCVGFVWLAAAFAFDWLRLPPLPVPYVAGALPWPTALLLGGLLARLAGGFVRRRAVAAGAARQQADTAARLRARVAEAADTHAVESVRAEVAELARLAAALTRAAR